MVEEDLYTLIQEGAVLTDRYLKAGPGSAAARPHLDAAITVLDRAYARLEPGEAVRGQVAGQVGWLYGIRHLAHDGVERDRSTAIHLLEESLEFPNIPPVLAGSCRIILGQLLLAGLTAGLRSPDAIMRMMQGGGTSDTRDADRAVALFREVAEGPQTSAEMTSVARTLLTVAEALRGMFGGPGGMDLGRMSQALAAMQGFQQQTGGGMPPPPMPDLTAFRPPVTPPANPYDGSLIAVVEGPIPDGGPAPRPRPAPEPPVSAADLRAQLASADDVDDRIALAAALVEAPGADPADHLALAAALLDRFDADGGSGWDDGPDDRQAAAESLDRAATALPGLPADDVLTAVDLAAQAGMNRLGAGYANVTEALRTAGIEAFVYPSPGGPVVLDVATGRLDRAGPGTHWSGRIAATGPVEHAGAVAYVRTAAQLTGLLDRGRRPVAEAAVFVANPRHDRDRATMDALRLRRAFYPHSRGLGATVEQIDGAGTPTDVRENLGASLLHLGCGITPAGALELAGPAELPAAQIAARPAGGPGGIAVLPPAPPGRLTLTDALLDAGYVAVIGFTAVVPDPVASLAYWVLHSALVDDGLGPADAVAATRAWLGDPQRKPPDLLAAEYQSVAAAVDLTGYASDLVCHGF